MAEDEREPFYNRIFFCDVVGYSQLDPLAQNACQRVLNDGVLRALNALGSALDDDVIALPTGDGLILNFRRSAADAHLRTALTILEHLDETSTAQGNRFGLRVGLNSWTDTCVRDINGKRNVVGSGVNLAQRVMDIGKHGQVMMHDRAREDLETSPQHAKFIARVGEFMVKHDLHIPVAQYVNPDLSYVSCELAKVPDPREPRNFDFADIMNDRAKEEVLRLHLDGRARSSMASVQAFIGEYFDEHGVFQDRKIWASWIAGELIENAFSHNPKAGSDGIDLVISKSPSGMLISILQPDVPTFQIPAVLSAAAGHDSFMQLMHRRGIKWDLDRPGGRMRLWAELSNDIRPATLGLNLTLQREEPASLPSAVAAFMNDVVSQCVEGGVALVRADGQFGRVDERNANEFHEWLTLQINAPPASTHSIIFDFSCVGYLSSRGLRGLTLAQRAAQARDMNVSLIITNPVMLEIMQISRYDKLFEVFRDVPSAWTRFKRS